MKKLTLLFVLILVLALSLTFVACDHNAETDESNIQDDVKLNDYPDWWNDDTWTTTEYEPHCFTQEELLANTGGFITGVCHPNTDFESIKDCNIGWVRFDLTSLPFDKDGKLTPGYLAFKAKAKLYMDNGLKVLCITPYPDVYIEFGLDPREESSRAEIMKIARFYAEDLQGVVAAFQITNEMGVEHFTLPLTIAEAADFIGMQLIAMQPYRQNIPIGYNLGGISGYTTLNLKMKQYLDYVDYIGADIYLACFDSIMVTNNYGTTIIDSIHKLMKKPMILTEFGYIGYGTQKTDEEKLAILKNYGAEGETLEEAVTFCRENMDVIVNNENFPVDFAEHLKLVSKLDEATTEEEIANAYTYMGYKMFDTELVSHLYCQLAEGYEMTDYKHTPEGQASFFADFIPLVADFDYMCGTIVYCWSDSDACYICGQSDCPVETGWGLVKCDGTKKPSYYAVQKAFADAIEAKNNID